MVDLAEHGTGSAHLPHQPFDDAIAAFAGFGQQLASLVREIDQNGARFHKGDVGISVDDCRDAVVGSDLEEIGCELLIFGNIDRVRSVGQAQFFERDGNLAAVGSRPGIEINHVLYPYFANKSGNVQGRRALIGEASYRRGADQVDNNSQSNCD